MNLSDSTKTLIKRTMKWIMFRKTFNNRKFVSMSENITQILDEPNNEITVDEILKAVYSLKNDKSASADLISNEMLKKAVAVLLKPLHK